MAGEFRLPNKTQRITIIGRTGSGKTQFGAWVLSKAPIDRMPYVMIDYKGDELIRKLSNVEEIDIKHVPKKPGLYVIRPIPEVDDDAVENFLWKMWEKENIGLYVDEGYAIPRNSKAFQALLTQGRSKRIPIICLTQRPAWLSKFVFSEADFFAVFQLTDRDDIIKVQRFLPKDRADISGRLPDFYSYWYDVKQNAVFKIAPVPEASEIVAEIDARLETKRKRL